MRYMALPINVKKDSDNIIYIIAGMISLFLSYWLNAHDIVINPDGICYLQSAATITSTSTHAAMQLCGQAQWPLYSLLISSVMMLLHVSYLHAAQCINSIFSLISVLAFIAIVKELGASKRVLWFSALTILLAHDFNGERSEIIRDHGYWALYLLSLGALLIYTRTLKFKHALLWSFAICVATLFRIEGAFFVLLMPWLCCLQKSSFKKRLLVLLQLNVLVLIIIAALMLCYALVPHQTFSLSRLSEVQFQIMHGFGLVFQHFEAAATGLTTHVFSAYEVGNGENVLTLLLIVWYLFKLISCVSLIYTLLIIYAWKNKLLSLKPSAKMVIWGYIFINLAITFLFLAQNMFIAKRYLIALVLTLIIWVPFALDRLIQYKKSFVAILILIFITSVSGIVSFGFSKEYIYEAGNWLNNHVSAQEKVYSNDLMIMYYSQHFGNEIFTLAPLYANLNYLSQDKWKQYDYLAIRTYKRDENESAQLFKSSALIPIKTFSNKRDDKVVIYQVLHEEA
jgi:hypothetical protein